MSAQILDGKAVGQRVQAQVRAGAAAFQAQHGRAPSLHLVLVGDDATSLRHVQAKLRSCESVGLQGVLHRLPLDVAQSTLLAKLAELDVALDVDGILVQLPLPPQLSAAAVMQAIDPAKDVDGLTPQNVGLLALGHAHLVPCTPAGCLRLLDEVGYPIAGRHALVIGRSALVGRPTAALLLARDATVSVAHSQSRGLAELVQQADIVVSAAGRAGLVRGEWIKSGAAVIDVGLNRDAAGKLCGDVEFATASERAGFISPVPGGVGPMTVAMLLSNTLLAATTRAS
jgi:methylenetetrahydrofolate dehydrogenase (NADP+)/methenyltetrahydrofolate cyclohydrolase